MPSKANAFNLSRKSRVIPVGKPSRNRKLISKKRKQKRK